MAGVRKNVEKVEVENVTDVTQEVKPGLLDKVKSGIKNFWSKHKTKLVVGTALVGAGMLAGAKLAKEEDEDEVYLIEVEADFEEVSEDEDEESETETDEEEAEDNNEETED
nr:MAG TPA: peroxin-3 [Caudoviricetes sp.]